MQYVTLKDHKIKHDFTIDLARCRMFLFKYTLRFYNVVTDAMFFFFTNAHEHITRTTDFHVIQSQRFDYYVIRLLGKTYKFTTGFYDINTGQLETGIFKIIYFAYARMFYMVTKYL